MSISLSLPSAGSLAINNLTDLKHQLQSFLKLDPRLGPFLKLPLSSLPDALHSLALEYTSGNQAWKPGAIGFTLSGGVCGKISVITSGDVVPYTGGFPTTVTLGVPDPVKNSKSAAKTSVVAPNAYLCLELDFKLSGGITGSLTSGVYGISTADNASGSITVAFYKQCTVTTPLQDAIVAAFSSFVLPLHPDTLSHLAPGDYLHYTFNGSLQLGLGATVGLDKVFYAGQFTADIPKTSTALATTAAIKPEAQAGAKLSFSYCYTGAFELMLWRDSPSLAHLHLYRSQDQTASADLDLGITLTTGTAVTGAVTTAQLETALTATLPALKQANLGSKMAGPASDGVIRFTGEMNDKLSAWLKSSSHKKADLDLAITNTQDRFLLTNYTIDLTQPYQPAWDLMVKGHFLDAFNLPATGVTLDTGSGLESVFTSATAVRLNLFGLFTAAWTAEVIANTSLVYAGDNTFHLISNQGRELLSQVGGSKSAIDLYFSAEANLLVLNAPLAAADINLHVLLQATANPRAGAAIAVVADLLLQGPSARPIVAALQALAAKPNTTQQLHLVFSPATYGKLLHAAPNPLTQTNDEVPDQANYAAFAQACSQLVTSSPQNFTSGSTPLDYHLWRASNIAANGFTPPQTALPNRKLNGDPTAGKVYLDSLGLDAMAPMIWNTLQVGTDFMNLCADIQSLYGLTIDIKNWQSLVARLGHIVKSDVDVDFIPPTALALATLCGAHPTTLEAPIPTLSPGTSLAITLTY